MPDHDKVYQEEAEQYHSLISNEDYTHNIRRALESIHPFEGTEMVDIGAGTGRLTCMFAPFVNSVVALDASQAMLDGIYSNAEPEHLGKIQTKVSDLRTIPLSDSSADVVTAGWAVCYIANSTVEKWHENLATTFAEMKRVVREGGTIIILETLGTGNENPIRPDILVDYYDELENTYGFSSQWIRTDYKFQSVNEAEQLTRFFFGDWLGDQVRQQQTTIVPECTGIWWLRV